MNDMHPEEAVRNFYKKLHGPCRILVACSGGGDSLGLLFSLYQQQRPDVSIFVATVDHALREGSRTEAEAVGVFCTKHGLSHCILTWIGEKPKSGLQAAARLARYHLLQQHALDLGADMILTAHNLEDQFETLTMRQARDAGAERGISPLVLIGGQTWLHRPFLTVTRKAIRDYLRSARISWIEDPSNRNTDFERVRVRNEMVRPGGWQGFAEASQRQLLLSNKAAAFIGAHVRFAGSCNIVSQPDLNIENEAHISALLHLIALRGGGTYLLGRQAKDGLLTFLKNESYRRYAVGSVIIEKCRGEIFIVREDRGLVGLKLAPKSSSIWDNRFFIENRGVIPALISGGGAAPRQPPLVDNAAIPGVPNRVRALLKSTAPSLIEGESSLIDVKPVIAPFRQFLPCERFPIAQVLANGMGLAHFPLPPFG